MAITKIKESDYSNKGIRVKNNPLGLSVSEAQRAFDELSLDVIIPAVNRMAGEIDTAVSDLQNKNTTNKSNIAKNTADIATNKSNIAKNTADIATNKSNIAKNTTDIATSKSNIAKNTTDIATSKSNIAKNTTDIATNKNDISALKQRVTTAETDISADKNDIKSIKEEVSNLQIDISTKAEKNNVLSKDNKEEFVPVENYNPATKKYVDDLISTSGGGDMLKTVYDKQNKGLDIYEYVDKHIDNKNNPHNVTAEQLGALTDESLTKEIIFNKINVLDIAHGGTGKTTADEAFGNLGKNFGFPNAKNVGDNTDLNTLTKSGFYFSAGSKNTTNTTNIPQIVYDTIRSYYELNMLVLGLANRVTQIAVYPYNNSTALYERMWVRTGVGTSVNSLSWSDWREILTDKNKPMGTYSGNGNLKSRAINTSGFGNVIVVYSQLGIAIITPNGAIVTENGGTSTYLSSTEAMYVNGTMTLATTNKTLNALGHTYSYECK